MTSRSHVDADTGMAFADEGSGPAVVLVHGIPGSAASWETVRGILVGEHRVITVDLLGFGPSSRPWSARSLQAPAQAKALARVLDDLGVRDATVAGHDFGGPVAAHLAARRPELVGGLVWLSGNAFPDTPVPFPLALVTKPLLGPLAERIVFSRGALRLMARLAARDRAVQARPAVGDRSQARSIRIIFASALRELERLYAPVVEALSGLDLPATVVWGDRDPFFPTDQAKRTAALLPDARVVVLDGAGHFPPEERPGDVAREIARVTRLVGSR